jgi:Cys-tRNA(Pro)/Cys-tRNA(Cys) deacylase
VPALSALTPERAVGADAEDRAGMLVRMPAKPPATAATAALGRLRIPFTAHPYRHDPRAGSFGEEAAAALGLDPAHVFKTLIASVDDRLVAAVLPVATRLDLGGLAAAIGGKRAALADPAVAERRTGYVVGGISPVGQRQQLPTVLDESALELPRLYVSGGRRGFDIGLAPADLLAATGGRTARIAR